MSSRLRRRLSRRLHRAIPGLALLALSLLTGCGNQGPPMPPLRAVPSTTADLAIRQQGQRLLLEFTYPQATPAGTALGGVTAVEVWETVQPPPREGSPAPLDPRLFEASAVQRLKLGPEDLGAATFGNRILIPLPLPETLPESPEARYFAVRTTGPLGDLSAFSNQVAIVPARPLPPPERISVTGRPEGVLVEWSGTAGAVGYNIYRRQADERSLGRPLQTAGPDDRSWLDASARTGQSYIYGVTAVLSRDPVVESGVASEQEIRYLDRFPPPPPLELVALAEGGRVRLVWRAVEADDLVGYHVYRRGAEGDFVRLTAAPLEQTEFADPGVSRGETYSYRVTAVDELGNESGPGAEVRASVPE